MSKRVVLWTLLSFALAPALTSGACKRKGIDAAEVLAVLTESEAQGFASELSQALKSCDQDSLRSMLDLDAMMRTAVRASDAPARLHESLLAELHTSDVDRRTEFCTGSGGSDELHFLRVHERAGKQTLLFRIIADESLNYLEFYPGKSSDQSTKVNDVYVYTYGQTFVETLAQRIDVILGDESVIEALQSLGDNTRDPKSALRALAALPREVRESKPLQLLKIQAASSEDDASYEAAISEFEKLFPGDPSFSLISIDGFMLHKNYRAALQSIDKLDASLGGDPHLDVLRVGILLEEGKDLGRATELAEKALLAQPESEDAHYLLLAVHMARHNFAGAIAIMQLMGERFELVFENEGLVPGDPNYAALKASPEWQAYLAKLAP